MSTAREVLWWSTSGIDGVATRPALEIDASFDVVIIGAGYTGLWSAYYLATLAPSLKIAVLESEFVGFGASGRNGGWLAASVPGSLSLYEKHGGRAAVFELVKAMVATVDEVLQVAEELAIDIDAIKSGCIRIATSAAQAARLKADVAAEQLWELGSQGWRMESVSEISERIKIPNVVAGAYTADCARINPAKLVIGLAQAVEKLGVKIFEKSPAVKYGVGFVDTAQHRLQAKSIIRATEGFTCHLPGQTRRWLPMNSSMIATEPLSPEIWREIGWENAETLSDYAHAYTYIQRTIDGRIAIGGRGNPYAYANSFDALGNTSEETIASLKLALHRFFPATQSVAIPFAWSGVLAVPRDWCAGVSYNKTSGLGWAGGYTGQGVAASNLAGRTIADLVLMRSTALTGLPWIDRRNRDWEPEPFRWLGVQAIYAAYRRADRIESNRTSVGSAPIARFADIFSGR